MAKVGGSEGQRGVEAVAGPSLSKCFPTDTSGQSYQLSDQGDNAQPYLIPRS